jgi:hypothetical protein
MKVRLAPWRASTNERRATMPQIIVMADRSRGRGEEAVMLKERVNVADFESDHFAAQLVERLGWAVSDAHDVERAPGALKAPEPQS